MLLSSVAPFILALGVFFGIYYYKYIDKQKRLLCLYLMTCIIFDFLSRYIGLLMGNNLIFWPLFSLAELLLFAMYYYSFIKTKKVLYFAVLLGIAYMFFEIIYIDAYDVKAFQSYAKITSSFLIVLIVLSDISLKVKFDQLVPKEEQYLNYAIMINFALNLFLLLPINLLVNASSSFITGIWIFYLFITVLFYSYLSYAIWKNGKNQKRLFSGS